MESSLNPNRATTVDINDNNMSSTTTIQICNNSCFKKCKCGEIDQNTFNISSNIKTEVQTDPTINVESSCIRNPCSQVVSVLCSSLSCLRFVVEVFLCNLALIIVAPLFILGMLLLSIFRSILAVYLKRRYNEKVFLMKGQDSFWALDEYANSCNFYAIHTYQGTCNLENIQQRINDGCLNKVVNGDLLYDRLKRKIVTKHGFHCWEHMGESFDIKNHVKYITDDSSAIFTEDQVFAEIQKKFDHPIKDNKPQWEILVVPHFVYNDPILSRKNHYACIYRINHAFTDGISSGNAIQHAISDRPVKLTVDPLTFPQMPLSKRILAHIMVVVLGPRAFLKALFLSEENCFHGKELTGPKTLGWARPIRIESLKAIKNLTKTSVTSVLVSALGGSLRSLAEKKNLRVPKVIHAVPTIAMLPYPSIKPQNRFTLTLLPIATGLETCEKRLKAAHEANKQLARSPDILMNFYMMSLMGLCPKWILKFIFTLTHATMLLSNIPGPAETSTFLGHPFVDIAVWSPLKNRMGIGMALFSYSGRIRCSIVADKTSCSGDADVAALINGFEDEILAIADLAGVSRERIFY